MRIDNPRAKTIIVEVMKQEGLDGEFDDKQLEHLALEILVALASEMGFVTFG